MKEKTNKCVMCGMFSEKGRNKNTGEVIYLHFIDPKTREQLCEKCNNINNEIYRERGEKLIGKLIIIKNEKQKKQ